MVPQYPGDNQVQGRALHYIGLLVPPRSPEDLLVDQKISYERNK